MLPGPALLDQLEKRFGVCWLDSNGQINVQCPFCHLRGMSEDTSGHLGLNFEKDAAHCVRCDWGRYGMRAWLRKNNITQSLDLSTFSSLKDNISAGKKEKSLFKHSTAELPSGCFRLDKSEFAIDTIFSKSLKNKHISYEEAYRHALCGCDQGRTKGYVIFPYFEDDEVVYWQGRACDPESKMRKYNPKADEVPLGKSYWLYNMEMLVPEATLYLAEGPLDVITLQSFLIKNYGAGHIALGLSGTALSFPDHETHLLNTQFGKIVTSKPKEVVVVFDKDAYKKGIELASILSICGLNSRAVEVPAKDPNDCNDEQLSTTLTKTDTFSSLKEKINNLSLPHDLRTRRPQSRSRSSRGSSEKILRYEF